MRACHRSVQNYKLEAITKQDKDIERVEKLKEIVNQIYRIVRDVTNNGGMDVGLPSAVLILEFNGFDKSKTKKKIFVENCVILDSHIFQHFCLTWKMI